MEYQLRAGDLDFIMVCRISHSTEHYSTKLTQINHDFFKLYVVYLASMYLYFNGQNSVMQWQVFGIGGWTFEKKNRCKKYYAI